MGKQALAPRKLTDRERAREPWRQWQTSVSESPQKMTAVTGVEETAGSDLRGCNGGASNRCPPRQRALVLHKYSSWCPHTGNLVQA